MDPDGTVLAELDVPDFPPVDHEPPPEDDRDTWAPVDLGPYVRGEITRPVPTVGLTRADGLRMLYPGKEHVVFGEMECGKSWFMLASALAELSAGRHVIYVHFEESDPSDTVERLLALGCPPARLHGPGALFHFIGPERALRPGELAARLAAVPFEIGLVLLDGVNEAMAMHALKINDADGAADFRRLAVKPFVRLGATVLSADHVTKNTDTRGRNQFGSVHKGNALSGSSVLLENVEPFGRCQRGASRVYVVKDRPGHLRRHGQPDKRCPGKTFMGMFVVDDSQSRGPDLWVGFHPPTEKPIAAEPDPLDEAVLAAIEAITSSGKQANSRGIRAKMGGTGTAVDAAVERLVLDGRLVEAKGAHGARVFTTVSDGEHDEGGL